MPGLRFFSPLFSPSVPVRLSLFEQSATFKEHVEFLAKCSALRDVPAGLCEVSEAKSRGEWSRKELSDCRHLRDGLSLINGGNIPPYTVTQASVTPGASLYIMLVQVCAGPWRPWLLLYPEPTSKNPARVSYRAISGNLRGKLL